MKKITPNNELANLIANKNYSISKLNSALGFKTRSSFYNFLSKQTNMSTERWRILSKQLNISVDKLIDLYEKEC